MCFSFRRDFDFLLAFVSRFLESSLLQAEREEKKNREAQLYWKHTDESSLLFCKCTVFSESNEQLSEKTFLRAQKGLSFFYYCYDINITRFKPWKQVNRINIQFQVINSLFAEQSYFWYVRKNESIMKSCMKLFLLEELIFH